MNDKVEIREDEDSYGRTGYSLWIGDCCLGITQNESDEQIFSAEQMRGLQAAMRGKRFKD